MTSIRQIAAKTSIALVVISFLVAYFSKSNPPSLNSMDAPSDWALLPPHVSGKSLANRLNQSSGLALVLTISEYSQKNAAALESLRAWATERFEKQPTFLIAPIKQDYRLNAPQSLFGSFCDNLFVAPRVVLAEQATKFVRKRVYAFHKSGAYQRLRSDFYDSFGKDREAALLLASYEFERMKSSIPVLLASLFWIITIVGRYLSIF